LTVLGKKLYALLGGKRMKVGRLRSVFLVVAVFTIGLFSSGLAQQHTLRIGLVHTPAHSYYQAFERFKENVETRSDGQVSVQILHSGQLGGEREMQEMVSLGTLEMSLTGVIVVYEPLFAIFELPFLYADRDHVRRVIDSGVIQEAGEGLVAQNLRLVAMFENGFRNITNSVRPINSPADVAGLSIRTPENAAQIETFRALGAVVTPMAFNELYGALQQGVVDGQENPLQNIMSGRLYEVQEHLAITGHIYNLAYVVASESFLMSLSEDLRAIVLEEAAAASSYQLDLAEALDDELLAQLEGHGMQVTYPDQEAFREATAGVYDIFFERFGDQAREYIARIQELQ
jgi:tripartite ATP-independent transporter DctP family solute receptor